MLKYLKIQNLAIIDSAELELESGFACLTGESGTGKSILIESLLLLGGSRASSDLVRTGTDKAIIEAEFEIELNAMSEENRSKLELLEDGQLILRREIQKDGRSRGFVNGVMVPINLLQGYGAIAFEIYGQHGQQRLLKPSDQLELFDSQTKLTALATQLESVRASFMADLKNYLKAKDGEAARLREIDFLRIQIAEIEEARITEDDEELSFQLNKARNRERIREDRQTLFHLADDRLIPDLKQSERCLSRLIAFHPEWRPYLDQISSTTITLADLRGEINENEQDDEETSIDALEERENVLNRLFMKYGRNIQEVLAERERLEGELKELENAGQGLEAAWGLLRDRYLDLSNQKTKLQKRRAQALKPFSGSIKEGLSALALKDADFQAALDWPDWPESLDEGAARDLKLVGPEFRFLFSSNPDEPVKPLAPRRLRRRAFANFIGPDPRRRQAHEPFVGL